MCRPAAIMMSHKGQTINLIAIDLSTSWNTSNVTQSLLSKDSSTHSGMPVPVLSRGALYGGLQDDANIYLWGGTTSPWNETFPGYKVPLPPQYSLWAYNQKSKIWDRFDTGQTIRNRPNGGPAAEATEQGLAFFFNGMVDDHSQTGNQFLLANDSKPFLEGMVVVDLAKKTAKNISTKAVVGDFPRSRGKMEYVKDVGSKGILVMIGGNRKNVQDYSNQFVGDLVSN